MLHRILVLDDSTSMRKTISMTFKKKSYTSTESENANKGLSITSSAKFDFKLLLTTESSVEKKSEGKATAVIEWRVKPFNSDALIATVQKDLN